MRFATPRRRQRGAALILFVTVLIMGIAWYTVGALGKAPVATAEREVKTAQALQAAKVALLAYVAQYAARPTTAEPGQLPCPESTTLTEPGTDPGACGAATVNVGRLPWKTLGIDQLRDGYGEPLWYMMRTFRNPPINFDTPGMLNYNGNTVVAMIIAPGAPLRTTGAPPAGCTAQNQLVATRNTAPLNAANFLECGVASGSLASPGDSAWTNDRAIAITAAEWVNAITPVIGDRLQREVAPAIRGWDAFELANTGRSWGTTYSAYNLGYLPFASERRAPPNTDYRGNPQTPSSGTVSPRGLMPIDPSCYNNAWTVNSVVPGGLLNILGFGTGCSDMGSFVRCQLQRIVGVGAATADITLTASNVGRAFRSTIAPADLSISNGGSATVTAASMPNTTSDASLTFRVTWPGFLALFTVVSVDIPHLQNAQIHSDPRFAWYWSNHWERYTWYAVTDDATISNTDASYHCDSPGGPGCLTVQDVPAASGNTNDKWLVLVLSGPPLSGQTRPSSNLADYFERQNASLGVVYQMWADTTAPFNDRVATCPFKYQDHNNNDVVICN